MSSPPIHKVIIAGGGTAGWMTAAALARVFGPQLDITLIESEAIGTIGVGEATIPPIARFNAMLRLDEAEFVRETKATVKLAIEFRDWLRPGHGYLHSFGEQGRDLGYIPFHHYWFQDRIGDLWDYDPNALACRQNRGAPGLTRAFHFDAGLYAAHLRRHAERLGVRRIEGRIVAVEQATEGGDIRALRLEDGREFAGDVFVDCSGFRGLMIEETLKTGYESWAHWLPCDRALAVPSARTDPLTPYTRATARPAGWQWRIPLQHRTGNGHVYCSAHMSDDEAHRILIDNLDGEALGEARPIRFATGRRKRFWSHNCVAIGLSGGFIEPLESTSIHLIQSAIERLVALFPREGDNSRLRREYNDSAIAEMDYIRDFVILHYRLNDRQGEPFWDVCRHMDIPDGLAHRIELFRRSAAIHPPVGDIFRLPSWLQVLYGQGIEPQTVHPFVDRVAPTDRRTFFAQARAAALQAANVSSIGAGVA